MAIHKTHAVSAGSCTGVAGPVVVMCELLQALYASMLDFLAGICPAPR